MSEKIIIKIDPDLEELIPGFLANRAKDVTSIRALLDADDFDAIRILGHSMKGAGGGYGFDRITELGDTIETAALAGDAATVAQGNDALDDYLSRVEPVSDA
ncbi:MAG: Hpt domain-containing protein [Gammaproteobacteria bacterium]